MTEEGTTLPAFEVRDDRVIIVPNIRTIDGGEWLHKDYVEVVKPWDVEKHVPPTDEDIALGSIGSFAEYVKRYGKPDTTNITYNDKRFNAVLDYHTETKPGRCRWHAMMPFVYSQEWVDWTTTHRLTHRGTIEFIEDHASQIVTPDASTLAGLLGALRANVNNEAVTELRPDGSTHVNFTQTRAVKGNASQRMTSADLPQTIDIRIPVLKGHVDDKGKPVLYKLTVRLRTSIGDDASLTFRFSIPAAEAAKEEVIQEQVADAKTRLKDFAIYRGGS